MKPAFKNLASSIRTFQAELAAADNQRRTAAQTAVRVEAHRLMKTLKTEVKAGRPGGRQFAEITQLARYLNNGPKKRAPFSRLAVPVRYWVDQAGGKYTVYVGYQDKAITRSDGSFVGGKILDDGTELATSKTRLSASWLRIAEFAQTGGNRVITEYQRKRIIRAGSYLKKRGKPESKAFFLRANKINFHTPARPIIDPFWNTHRGEAFENIRRNFVAKLAGQKI